MKIVSPRPFPRAAFTLVEMLVVITIIIVLAGLLFPAFGAVQERAKKVQAANDEQAIINAVKNYSTEYGKLPLTNTQAQASQTANSDTVYSNPGSNTDHYNEQLVTVLRGQPHGTDGKYVNGGSTYPYNARQVAFIEARSAKDANAPKNGLSTRAGEENRWYDAWGTPYCVWLDANYDNTINSFLDVYTGDASNPLPQAPVAVASFGKDLTPGDKAKGTKKYNGSDDVVSWR